MTTTSAAARRAEPDRTEVIEVVERDGPGRGGPTSHRPVLAARRWIAHPHLVLGSAAILAVACSNEPHQAAAGGGQPTAARGQIPATASAPAPAAVGGSLPDLSVPRWSQEAIWYQIFVERFRNGDPTNDPEFRDLEGMARFQPEGWAPTPWGHDWYREEAWAAASDRDFYETVQLRRYGGDLQGVIDRLDYLEDLGVTALYLNPVNDAPSLHKFDARNYRHIDRNFGPDPNGDESIMATDDPVDPSTWRWTAADRLFLDLVEEVHRRGMRIIVDYSWNHTGVVFWAWRDVLANQDGSPYAGWYDIERFDDPATPDTSEFAYDGWLGIPDLPEWRKIGRPPGKTHGPIEGTLVPQVRELVFNVTRRWLDPNGDGDPSDGIDGFRLDVADMVPVGFWREYRQFVRSVNPEAYLVGEVWWEEWPARMWDPEPWLRGDVFDAVMHYQWYMPTRSFFAGTPPGLTASAYVTHLDSITGRIDREHAKALMNLTASHDSPRFASSVYNPVLYKYRVNPRERPDYKVDRPDARSGRIQRMILVQQFTTIGAPHIWNGDEVGMWGADDPDNRKPMIWSDLTYEPETAHPFGRARRSDPVVPDTALLSVYEELIALRKRHLELFVDGELNPLFTEDERGLLAYERRLGPRRAVVAFNRSTDPHRFVVEAEDGVYTRAFPEGGDLEVAMGSLAFDVSAESAVVWIRR